jgi:hypothetical protein
MRMDEITTIIDSQRRVDESKDPMNALHQQLRLEEGFLGMEELHQNAMSDYDSDDQGARDEQKEVEAIISLGQFRDMQLRSDYFPCNVQVVRYVYRNIDLKATMEPKVQIDKLVEVVTVRDKIVAASDRLYRVAKPELQRIYRNQEFGKYSDTAMNYQDKFVFLPVDNIRLSKLRISVVIEQPHRTGNVKLKSVLDREYLDSVVYNTDSAMMRTSLLLHCARIVENLVNNAYDHKFKWRVFHAYPMIRQLGGPK